MLIDQIEKDLVDALAGSHGPDLFMIHSTWLPKHWNKIRTPEANQIDIKNYSNIIICNVYANKIFF